MRSFADVRESDAQRKTTAAAGLMVRPKWAVSAIRAPRRCGSIPSDSAAGTIAFMIATAGAIPEPVIVARPHDIEPPVSIAATGGSRERPEVIASIRPLVLTASAKSVAVTISEMTCVYA